MQIIILGNGNAGSFIYKYFKNFYNPRYIKVINLTRTDFNATNIDVKFFKSIINQGDVVINCVGVLKPNIKSVGELNTYKINSIFPHQIYNICNYNSANFIHICSDCVYDGKMGNYKETSPTNAEDIYGISKSLVSKGTIIRTSFIGSKGGLMKWVLDNKNSNIKGYTNCLWNGITTLELTKQIQKIIMFKSFWNGVRHMYNPITLSKYDVCSLINKIYNLNIDIEKIIALSIEGTDIVGVLDRSLLSNYNKFFIPSIEKQLEELYEYESKQS